VGRCVSALVTQLHVRYDTIAIGAQEITDLDFKQSLRPFVAASIYRCISMYLYSCIHTRTSSIIIEPSGVSRLVYSPKSPDVELCGSEVDVCGCHSTLFFSFDQKTLATHMTQARRLLPCLSPSPLLF